MHTSHSLIPLFSLDVFCLNHWIHRHSSLILHYSWFLLVNANESGTRMGIARGVWLVDGALGCVTDSVDGESTVVMYCDHASGGVQLNVRLCPYSQYRLNISPMCTVFSISTVHLCFIT